MVELEEKDLLLASLKGYLEELRESGVDELAFGTAAPPVAPAAASPAKSVPAAEVAQAAAESAAEVAPAATPAGNAPSAAGVVSAAEAAAPAKTTPVALPAEITAQGNSSARLLFVLSGAGFSGDSGALLARIVIAMGFAPETVCLLSFPAEEAQKADLRSALLDKISQVRPEVVVALGETSAQLLLDTREPISRLRGRFQRFQGAKLMATLHPDQLLADESLKRDVWNEMKQVMAALG